LALHVPGLLLRRNVENDAATTVTELTCAENIQWYPGKDADVPRAEKPDF
jgi:hypothetical protein